MNISARDIKAFLALAEVKNFTRAASLCHLSQPAFSALIKALEGSVGLQLFDRSTRHVLLTKEGERFYLSAQRIDAELQDCAKAMRDTAQLSEVIHLNNSTANPKARSQRNSNAYAPAFTFKRHACSSGSV